MDICIYFCLLNSHPPVQRIIRTLLAVYEDQWTVYWTTEEVKEAKATPSKKIVFVMNYAHIHIMVDPKNILTTQMTLWRYCYLKELVFL